jgi:membrane protease YdiL (CAAX protease family)
VKLSEREWHNAWIGTIIVVVFWMLTHGPKNESEANLVWLVLAIAFLGAIVTRERKG